MDGIVIIGGGAAAAAVIKSKPDAKVTVIMANEYLEWALACTYALANPNEYMRFVSPNKSTFEHRNATYVYDMVTSVNVEEKKLSCASGREIPYGALIVASGYKLPIINAKPGTPLPKRIAEIEHWGSKIAAAETVVINGAGAIGLELACDIKIHHPSKRVVVLSRSGNIFSGAYPDSVLATFQREVKRIGVEVLKGTISGADGGTEPLDTPGVLQLSDGSWPTLAYDVFLPAFMQGVNTEFLPSEMLTEGAGAKLVRVNEYLQSVDRPEIFAVALNDSGEGFSLPLIAEQAKSVAKNAARLVKGEPLVPYQPNKKISALNWHLRPAIVKLGYGPGGFASVDNIPACPDTACITCLGFPFCIPPCCWPCCGGAKAAFAFGTCCSKAEGQGTMAWYLACFGVGGVKVFPKAMADMKGFGEAPKGGGPPSNDEMKRK